MSQYHPDEFYLMDYAAGNLSAADALIVSVHLSVCPQCQARVRQSNLLGGVMLEKLTPAVDDTDLDAFIESLPARNKSASEKPKQGFINPLDKYVMDFNQLAWQKQTQSISKLDLTHLVGGNKKVTLQKILAGAKVPPHTHRGTEYTLVLSGGFSDELGCYHKGDFIVRDSTHHHSPTALQNEDCICLTVLDAPIRFTGWMRLLNPFIS